MIGSLFTAISGLNANRDAMTVVGDNIANVNTTGFKSSSMIFANVLNQSLAGGTEAVLGSGVQVQGTREQWDQGSLEPTGSTTDLAISGRGMFRLRDSGPTGTDIYYTRAGNFTFDANGYLVSPDDHVVQGYDISAGAVAQPPAALPVNVQVDLLPTSTHRSYSMGEDGVISGVNRTTGVREDLWQVSLYDFPNTAGLTKYGGNIYAESSNSGTPLVATGGVSGHPGLGKVIPGNLEMSNVDLAREFSNMIVTQKAFQANAKVITTSDEILTALIGIKR